MQAQTELPSGPELRKLRLAAGVEVTLLARVMGVTQPALSKLERGLHQPRLATVLRYLAALPLAQSEQQARIAARLLQDADVVREELVRLAGRSSS
jgi:predicted transcriptional regulator